MKTYIIRAGKCGPVKIGRARNVHARRSELQTGNHEELYIVRIIEGDVETGLHRRFSHLSIHREWFRFDAEMLTFLPADTDGDLMREYRRALDMPEPPAPKTVYLAVAS